jgi:A/G-specific adenine glycosylase
LGALPGIGEYTARAVGAIAFDVPAVPVDGNVERVVARLFSVTEKLPAAKPALRRMADLLGADPHAVARPGDFAQALFDLGATVCTPAAPACGLCPWMPGCAGRLAGIAAELPRRAPKPLRPLRHGVHFWLEDERGHVLLRRRPEAGLLGGMAELPGTSWRAAPWQPDEALALAPMPAAWRPAGQVRHGFTHFALTIELFAARVAHVAAEGFLHPVGRLDEAALPSVMRKCVAMAAGGRKPLPPAAGEVEARERRGCSGRHAIAACRPDHPHPTLSRYRRRGLVVSPRSHQIPANAAIPSRAGAISKCSSGPCCLQPL